MSLETLSVLILIDRNYFLNIVFIVLLGENKVFLFFVFLPTLFFFTGACLFSTRSTFRQQQRLQEYDSSPSALHQTRNCFG